MKIDTRIIIGVLVIIFVLALGYSTVSNYLVEFKTVSEVTGKNVTGMIWVNGTIVDGSFVSLNTGGYNFIMTDGISRMNVNFTGELPSSLGTDAEIVVFGTFDTATFQSSKMVAKCPTKYKG